MTFKKAVSTEVISTPYDFVSGSSHSLYVNGEHVLTTRNLSKAEDIKAIFDRGMTVDSLKQKHSDSRHSFMIQLMCSGHSKLAETYFSARATLERKVSEYLDTYPTVSSQRVLASSDAVNSVGAEVLALTGWEFRHGW
ncbi:hypothetical protein [Vibrio agarivorans]|uniref:Uncharacterized protein n=1 Tax=Vibrio agarivorans TaxID=153622 RepID=A0ABT7Y745_9VIBR|nr:hypothetical protein [Vibrio agarivorans]MDN2483863.1 hypothetical protein [Vibrio agarivorans]